MSESDEKTEAELQAEYVAQVQVQIMEILNKVKDEVGSDMPIEVEVVNANNEEDNE